jgi:hypothetical protein
MSDPPISNDSIYKTMLTGRASTSLNKNAAR